jgi:hypothetical protein
MSTSQFINKFVIAYSRRFWWGEGNYGPQQCACSLLRNQLHYILDPADIEGPDSPSDIFRVLQKNDMKNYGGYRNHRLALDIWNRLDRGNYADVAL